MVNRPTSESFSFSSGSSLTKHELPFRPPQFHYADYPLRPFSLFLGLNLTTIVSGEKYHLYVSVLILWAGIFFTFLLQFC